MAACSSCLFRLRGACAHLSGMAASAWGHTHRICWHWLASDRGRCAAGCYACSDAHRAFGERGGWQRTQLVTAGLTKLRSYLGFVNLGWRDRDHISVSSAQSGLARSRLQSRFRQLRVVAEAPIGQGQTQHLHVCVCVCVSASGGSRQCEGPQASTPPVLHKGIYESEVFLNHPLRASPTREGPAEDGRLGFPYSCIFVWDRAVYVGTHE